MSDSSEGIRLIRDHEEALGKLYAEYAARFKDQEAFWNRISQEEEQHAEWVRSLESCVEKKEAVFVDKFQVTALQTSLKFIHAQIDKARNADITFAEALSISLSIENSMLEKKFFEAFSGDSAQVQKVKKRLIDETRQHRVDIENAWDKHSRRMV